MACHAGTIDYINTMVPTPPLDDKKTIYKGEPPDSATNATDHGEIMEYFFLWGSRVCAMVRALAFHNVSRVRFQTRRHMWAEFVGSLLSSESI